MEGAPRSTGSGAAGAPPSTSAGPRRPMAVQELADRPVRDRGGRRLVRRARRGRPRDAVLRADRGGRQPRYVVRPAPAPGRGGDRRRRGRGLPRRPDRGRHRLGVVAAGDHRRARHVDRGAARRRSAVHDAGGGAVDRRRDAGARPGCRPDPLDRRRDRRPGGARGGDRRPGRAAATTARAGGTRGPQGRRAAARRRRRDGRGRGRPRARAAGRRAVDRPLRQRAPGGGRRGAGRRRVLAVPGAPQGQPEPDGRPGRPDRPRAAQHPGAGPADGGHGVPRPAGAPVLRPALPRPGRRRRRGVPTS